MRAAGSDNPSGFGRHRFILQLVVRLFDEGEAKAKLFGLMLGKLSAVVFLLFACVAWADQVALKNGDRVTGKILKKDGATLRGMSSGREGGAGIGRFRRRKELPGRAGRFLQLGAGEPMCSSQPLLSRVASGVCGIQPARIGRATLKVR